MAHQGAYRTAAARASQYRLELDHLKYSRDNAMRREHELERALDEERHRSSTREAELKRNLRNAKRHGKLNQAAALRASARGGGLSAAGHAGYAGVHGGTHGAVGHANPTGVYQSEAEKLALERRLLTENRRVLELEEELDRQLTREQRMKRQLERLRQEEELCHHRAGTGVPVNYPVGGYPNGMNGMYADQRSYDQALSLANLRSALAVQQAEIEDLQRVKREMREQIGMEREMRNLDSLEARERQMIGHGTPYYPANGMNGSQYPGANYGGGPMGQQQVLHQMQAENQRMMNELQRIRQTGGGAVLGAQVPAAGLPMGGVGGYPMATQQYGQHSHIALQQMEVQLQAQLQWIKQQQQLVTPYAPQPMVNAAPVQPMMTAGMPAGVPVGPLRQPTVGVDGNMQITVKPGGTMPARYAPAASGTSTIDPATGTRNWRVQGGLSSAAMAAEGKAKQGKLSRKVAWVEPPSAQEVGQEFQVQRLNKSTHDLELENQAKQRQLEQMERELLALHDL